MTSEPETLLPDFNEPSKEYTSPLLDFWGTGAGWTPMSGIGKNSGRPWRRYILHFILEPGDVLDSTEPYPMPVAELSFFYNPPKDSYKKIEGRGVSEWEALAESFRKLGYGRSDAFDELFGGRVEEEGETPEGKRMHWKKVPMLLNVPGNESNPKYHDEEVLTWQLIEVEGVVGAGSNGETVDALTYALQLANGKTEDEFRALALQDRTIYTNPGITNSLTSGQFVINMMSMGKLARNEATGVLTAL